MNVWEFADKNPWLALAMVAFASWGIAAWRPFKK